MVRLNSKNQTKSLGRLSLELLKTYLRMDVEGTENIPRQGRALVIGNHSGFIGADAVLATSVIKRHTKRRARILAHRLYFDFSERLKKLALSHGLLRAAVSSGVETLNRDQLMLIFPEGEAGNFKSSVKRYQLQKFHAGFLLMALKTRSPIVPCLILGAEETHLNLGNLNLSGRLKNVRIPMPMNLLPLPAKWKIVFLPPIPVESFPADILEKPGLLKREAAKIQRLMQKELNRLRREREYIYSARTREFVDRVGDTLRRFVSP